MGGYQSRFTSAIGGFVGVTFAIGIDGGLPIRITQRLGVSYFFVQFSKKKVKSSHLFFLNCIRRIWKFELMKTELMLVILFLSVTITQQPD